jgi:hypothetical protein
VRVSLPASLTACVLRCLLAVVFVLAYVPTAGAEDRLTVSGNYYREQSNRVLSPEVEVSVDAPDERLTFGAVYLLDAVSSASIASGAAQVTGGDAVFTELRHEATGKVSSRLSDWQLGGFFRYSTETDYQSRSLGASFGRDLLQRSINLSASYAYNFDRVYRIFDSTGRRLPWCGGAAEPNCVDSGTGPGSNLLQTHYGSLGYSHALHPTVLFLATVEYANVRGPQDNGYRGGQIPGVEFETHPLRRNRFGFWVGTHWHIPGGRTTIEPRYRFYADDGSIIGNAPELRVHFRVTTNFRLRLRYRFYTQTRSFFWTGMIHSEVDGECTPNNVAACASADPKMSAFRSHTAGIQLTYQLDRLAQFRGLHWLENGWVQATYNYMHQTNRYGPVRALGSLAFSLAF